MSDLQIGELFKIVGRWMPREEAISFIVEKKSKKGKKPITRRYAYKLMKNDKKVKKHRFQDGPTIYGLTEFGPPPLKWGPQQKSQPLVETYDLDRIEKTWISYAKTQIPWYRGGRAARSFAEEYERLSRKDKVEFLRKKSKEYVGKRRKKRGEFRLLKT